MIYSVEFAKPILKLKKAYYPIIFTFDILTKILKIPELCYEALCFCLGEVHPSYKAQYVWLENVSSRSFEVCIKEFLPFDGKHHGTVVVGMPVCFLIVS